ncbi:MAG: rhodanese-like domain-containing protein [Chlorobi bacterium]|nr:rhodanese-like domain-containing protein [Chlorobiota bacterium]
MLKYFVSLPLRKRVGLIGILLGFIAIFAPDPYHRTTASVNTREIALETMPSSDQISVEELADWIINGNMDYRLIDLRSPEKYREYNIPTSECVIVKNLPEADIARNEKILLYSDNDLVEAQAWYLLKSMGFKSVTILRGGLEKWEKEILYPSIPENASAAETEKYKKIAEVSKFFGGEPQTGTEQATVKKHLPKPKAPAKINLKHSKKKKKREGC